MKLGRTCAWSGHVLTQEQYALNRLDGRTVRCPGCGREVKMRKALKGYRYMFPMHKQPQEVVA